MGGEPSRRLAVVACMDARLPVREILGLGLGEAHIIRNAGGVVTDDVIRSLALSQLLLGTREIVLVHHTDCGLQSASEEAIVGRFEEALGVRPPWPIGAFEDPSASVRRSMEVLSESPFLLHKNHISGFVYNLTTGQLEEVAP